MAKLKYCGHCGHEKLTTERRAELTKRSEELHGMGIERFMLEWEKANDLAVGAARSLEMDYTAPDLRTLLSMVAFRILSMTRPQAKETKTT